MREELIKGKHGRGYRHDSLNCSPISWGLEKNPDGDFLKPPARGSGPGKAPHHLLLGVALRSE